MGVDYVSRSMLRTFPTNRSNTSSGAAETYLRVVLKSADQKFSGWWEQSGVANETDLRNGTRAPARSGVNWR